MTARGLLELLLRRWYLIVVGAILTVMGMYVTLHQPGVYWTKLTLVLLAPAEEYYPNKIQDPHYALAPMAGVVVAEWNRDYRPRLSASGDTTLVGEGKREAVEVRMPNQGSQWRPLYLSPNIDVQVVGSNPDLVQSRATAVSNELATILQRQQDDIGVNADLRITAVRSPAEPTVYYVTGSRPRALASVGLIGALVSVVAVYWIDRFVKRKVGRRHLEAPDTRPEPGDFESASSSSRAETPTW